MKSYVLSAAVLGLICTGVAEAGSTVAGITHVEFQAIDAMGEQT
jgi:hypothetical protein